MQFIDFEVFLADWLCVIIEPDDGNNRFNKTVIINDPTKLREYYENHQNDIWVGFNIRHYDQYIFKAILLGMNPKKVNDYIIIEGHEGWKYSDKFRNIPLFFYDVINEIDRGLKYFEGSMGSNIKESSVPFNIPRKLTSEELDETVRYCTHDVEQTMEVFARRVDDFKAQLGLLKMFNLPLSEISKTKVQLSARILGAEKRRYHDEFDIDIPPTLEVERYQEIVDWYRNPENYDYSKSLDTLVAGVSHSFGWGGVHGARLNYVGEGFFINMDVASLYPSLMIRYDLISRSCHAERFKDIVETRLRYKVEKNPLQAPLKIVINGTYGASKDKNNPLYDPRQANRVCVYGQLLLLDLLEHLEDAGAEIIQSNTDGVLVRMPDGYQGGINRFYKDIDDVAYEWEHRTGLNLEFDEYRKVYQGDVNNYLIIAEDGHWKSKGAYLKKLSDLDYDLAIVNEAVVENLLHDTPVERTIYGCNELKKFQLVKRISQKYRTLLLGKKEIPERCVRVFASISLIAPTLYKTHVNGRTSKVEGTPEHCFLDNDDMTGKKVPPELDRRWYITLANTRLAKFKRKKETLL